MRRKSRDDDDMISNTSQAIIGPHTSGKHVGRLYVEVRIVRSPFVSRSGDTVEIMEKTTIATCKWEAQNWVDDVGWDGCGSGGRSSLLLNTVRLVATMTRGDLRQVRKG